MKTFLLYLSLLPVTHAAFLQNFFQVDGFANNNGEFIGTTVQTLPLSSTVDFVTFQDGGFQETFTIPLKLAFPSAPVGALKIFSTLGVVIGAIGSVPQFITEPVQADCNGAPCPFTPAIFAPELVLDRVEVTGGAPVFGPDLHGKSFDVQLRVNFPVALHAMNPGFNAKSTMLLAGPSRYEFSIVTSTTWEGLDGAAVPEPTCFALAALGLLALAGWRWFRHGLRS